MSTIKTSLQNAVKAWNKDNPNAAISIEFAGYAAPIVETDVINLFTERDEQPAPVKRKDNFFSEYCIGCKRVCEGCKYNERICKNCSYFAMPGVAIDMCSDCILAKDRG